MTFLTLLASFLVLESLKTVGWRPFFDNFSTFFGQVETAFFEVKVNPHPQPSRDRNDKTSLFYAELVGDPLRFRPVALAEDPLCLLTSRWDC